MTRLITGSYRPEHDYIALFRKALRRARRTWDDRSYPS